MNIAELFIKIGAKGDDKVKKQFKDIQSGMGNMKLAAVGAVAAIAGITYALERLMSESAQRGMDLEKFANYTGKSTDTLQRWQVAMRTSGVTAEDVTSSIKGIQMQMGELSVGQGTPKGMGLLAQKLGGLDFEKATKDTDYMLQKLREYAVAEKNIPIANLTLKSFGLGDDFIAALRTNVGLTEEALKKIDPSKIFSKGEVKQNANVNVAWTNINERLKMLAGHFTAKHGMSIVNGIAKVTEAVYRLVTAFTELANKVHIFDQFAAMFGAFADSLTTMADMIEKINDPDSERLKKKAELTNKTVLEEQKLEVERRKNTTTGQKIREIFFGVSGSDRNKVHQDAVKNVRKQSPIVPAMKVPAAKEGHSNNITIQQDLNFQHPGENASSTASSVSQAIKVAAREMSVQLQGA